MNHFVEFVIQKRKGIIVLYSILMVIGIILFFLTSINYNMMDYLPQEANSTIAIEKMEEEFDQPIPNLNVMVEDVSLISAQEIKQRIKEADYVKEVIWLDDSLDLKKPLQIQPADEVEAYYKDNAALFMVTVEDGEEQAAIAAVKEAAGGECKISGTAADQADAQQMATQESVRSIILLVPVILLILIVATTSWVEPLLYLMTLGAAVLINLGSGFFMGEMSFVTLAAAPILQMAVSLDYAVFLSHSFSEHREKGLKATDAMRLAIRASGKSISASMLTTLFGFIALMFMKFRIGSDMGISLVKGVLLSFLCVMTLLPALLLAADKWIKKTKHRRFLPDFKGIGHKIMKVYIPIVILLMIVMVPSYLAQNNNEYFYGTGEEAQAGSDADAIEQVFGTTNSIVLLVPRGSSEKELLLCEELKEIPHITGVISYTTMVSNKIPTEYLDESIVSSFYSESYARIILSADCAYEGDKAFGMVEQVRSTADSYYPDEYYTCGQSANMYDMKEFVQEDNKVVNIITMVSIYVILMLMTKSWLMPLPLILTIKCSIWINMAIPYFSGESLSYLGYLIVSTVQMGATVDYAILLTDKYMEKRMKYDKMEAMKQTLGEIFSAIIISSATLTLAGLCLGITSSNSVVKILGTLVGRGAILALVLVMLMLPALLVLFDGIILRTVWGYKKRKEIVTEGEWI